ncbi:TolC family protein [Arcticibacter sp. MXS-1]|uniref:TolC family protein n=1 Tax=Arcticibacter sp. MXS-1 TaxID=3341726 RepID=UPI0035A9AD36
MKYKKLAAVLMLIILACARETRAQETMLNNFSYLYLERLVAVAKENYPRSKVFEEKVSIAKNNIATQKISWLDPLSFTYYRRSGDNTVSLVDPALLTGHQFGVSINPGSFFNKPFAVKTAKEQLKIAVLDQQEYSLQLESEVKRRYLFYLQNQNSLRLQAKMVLDAESSFKDIKNRYEKGEISFRDYNEASLSLSSTLQARINAEAALMSSKVALEELLVKKLEEIK